MTPYRSPPAHLEHVRCNYGGTGVSAVGYCAMLLDFEILAAALLNDVRVSNVELFEGERAFARIVTPIELRVWHPGRDRDHNEITTQFAGTIDPGARVRLRIGGELAPQPVTPAMMARARYRATVELTTTTREQLVLEGPVDGGGWATAGPARRP